MSRPTDLLAGRSILVIEDEYLVALYLAQTLQDEHATVIGPVGDMEGAMHLARTAPDLDGALLNVNLRGRMVFPVADILLERKVPFAFVTGYEHDVIPARYAGVSRFGKNPTLTEIATALFG